MVNGVSVHADFGQEQELLELPVFRFESGKCVAYELAYLRFFVAVGEVEGVNFFGQGVDLFLREGKDDAR